MEPFIILQSLSVLVCKECQTGCLVSEIPTHLRDKHPRLSPNKRNAISAHLKGIPGLAQDQQSLKSFRFPPPESAAIPMLPGPFRDAFACTECVYVVRQLDNMKAHCRKNHGWSGKADKRPSAVTPMWRSNVSCQQLFASRTASKLFEVERGHDAPRPAPQLPEANRLLEHVLSYSQQQYKKIHSWSSTVVEAADEKHEPNRWLQRVQWATHLRGLDYQKLSQTMALTPLDTEGSASETEQLVMLAIKSVRRVIRAAQETARTSVVGHAVLIEINGQTNPSENRVVFRSGMEKQTLVRYTKTLQKIIAYIIRTIEEWQLEERPQYKFTPEQTVAYDKLIQCILDMTELSRQTSKAEVDKLMLAFLISIFDHRLNDDSYESALISGLAVLGIRGSGQQGEESNNAALNWLGPYEYTPYYAAVLKTARLLVIRWAYLEHQEQAKRVDDARPRSLEQEPEEKEAGLFETVRSLVRRFMIRLTPESFPTPIAWILESLAYGVAIRKATIIQGKIHWTDDEVTFERVTLEMVRLREMIQMAIEEVGLTMSKLLFLSEDERPPAIKWAAIREDMGNYQAGYSFLSDDRNDCFADRSSWLVRRITASPELAREWLRDEAQPFRPKASGEYLRLVNVFRSRLLFLVHLTAGQPARRTEILPIRFENTTNGTLRNIFVQQGLVCIVTWYHKNYLARDAYKAIYRYLPEEVGEHLVRYLWLVLPFAQQLQSIDIQRPKPSSFLWGSAIVQDDGLEPPKPLTSQPREVEDGDGDDDDDDEDDEDASNQLLPCWRPDKMTYIMKQTSQRLIGVPITIRAWRQIIVAITRRFLNPSVGSTWGSSRDETDSSDDDGFENYIEDLQSGHTSLTAGSIYGRQAEEGLSIPAIQQDRFRQASRHWHRFLGLKVEGLPARQHKRSFGTFNEQVSLSRMRRLDRLSRADLQGQFCQMLGKATAKLRPRQLPVLRAIARGETPILQVMATGAGKSLSFMLPAYCTPRGVNIVIVPMLALQGDLVARFRQNQISVDVWRSDKATRAASAVLVTPESAATKGFRDFVNGLIAREQLDRVFIDECHLVLDGSYEFRPAFLQLGDVVGDIGVQLILMTATLPPHELPTLCQRLALSEDRVRLYRSSTNRCNIHYVVTEVPIGIAETQVLQIYIERMQEYYPGGKIIIYCRRTAQVDEVSALLKCPAYYSHVATVEVKEKIIRDFRAGGSIIAATNALGVGLDIPDVRGVIHMGYPSLLRDYVQETGRAGRDDGRCEAILITKAVDKKALGNMVEPVDNEPVSTSAYVQWDGCRRVFLDKMMDGVDRAGVCTEFEERCDFCEGQEEEESAEQPDEDAKMLSSHEQLQAQERRTREAVSLRRIEQARSFSELESLLRLWQSRCVVCIGEGRSPDDKRACHSKGSCTLQGVWTLVERSARDVRAKVFTRQRLAQFSGCFRCGLPQRVCESWETEDSGGRAFKRNARGRCQYYGIVEQVIGYMQAQSPRAVRGVIGRLQKEGFKYRGAGLTDDFYAAVGRRRDWGEEQSNWLCYYFYLLNIELGVSRG